MALHSYKQGEFSDTLVGKHRNGYLGSDFLEARCSGVGAQMADNELEEGEACDDTDSGCDPDTAFAYLDEKLSMVLGDVQKFFEGGVSAEKLGSKFGGYGSFLPTQERMPSILLQDKPATAVASDAYCRSKKSSSNEGLVEKTRQAAVVSSVQANNFKAGSGAAVLMHENGGRDAGLANEKASNIDSSFQEGRVEQNASVPKKVLLRIKMGSDNGERKKNTKIYDDFGLGNSSSASEDEDVDEEQDSDQDSSPDRTPLTMIRIMTSHHIPGGMLLSPLPDLGTEPFLQKERLLPTNLEVLNEKARSPSLKKVDSKHDSGLVKDDGDAFEKMDISRERTREHASEQKVDSVISSDHGLKRGKGEKEKGGSKDSSRHSSKLASKTLAKDLRKSIERDSVCESVRSIEEFNRSSLEKAPHDYSLYEPEEHVPKDFCSPFQPPREVDSGREVLSRGYRGEKAATSSSPDSLNEHLYMGRDAGKGVFSTVEINSHGKRHLDDCAEPVDGRKRSSGKEFIMPPEGKTKSGQDAKRATSKSTGGKYVLPAGDIPATHKDLGKEVPEAKKRSKDVDALRVSSKERGKEASTETHRSSGKEKHIKASSSKGLMVDETTKGGSTQHSYKTALNKDFQQLQQPDVPTKVQRTESVEHKKKEKSKDRIRLDFKEPLKLSEEDKQKELPMREVSTKAAHLPVARETVSSDQPIQSTVPPPESENSGNPYVLVMDNWVACDKCEKWRLLPPGVDIGQLPQKWRCKMLYWLDGMNSCNIPEEGTTRATQALYNIPPPVPASTQENLHLLEPTLPPAPVETSLPPPSVNPSRETKATDKTRAVGNKKRKIPSVHSTEVVVQGKTKTCGDASQGNREANEAKLGGGDPNTDHEKIQVKLGSPDAGHAKPGDSGHTKAGEEKWKAKEREKAKRLRVNDGASPFGKEHNQTPANMALRDATNLKHTADRVKESKEGDCTGLYLQAALKFLQGASMLEAEILENRETKRDHVPLNIYADTAKLCEWCARSYECSRDFAAASLAYKCTGLALMRVVQAKSVSISKDMAQFQSIIKDTAQIQSAHNQGESPSSMTAVDMDHNNLEMNRVPARGNASPTGGQLIIAAKSRPCLKRVLQYVAYTNKAVNALSKSYNAFTAAESASVHSSEVMSALKRVLDFSFHDVMNFVQLVRIALEAMGH